MKQHQIIAQEVQSEIQKGTPAILRVALMKLLPTTEIRDQAEIVEVMQIPEVPVAGLMRHLLPEVIRETAI